MIRQSVPRRTPVVVNLRDGLRVVRGKCASLDLAARPQQTQLMYNTFLVFDFGAQEDSAQQAWHKLDVWKQTSRLDKKLLFKFDREEEQAAAEPEPAGAEKSPAKGKAEAKKAAKAANPDGDADTKADGKVKLFVRLYFSPHEKLSYQRWVERIPTEEPFRDASPKVIKQGEPGFDAILEQFETLE
jgi:hypothetical protein